jgi:hypothetical protein
VIRKGTDLLLKFNDDEITIEKKEEAVSAFMLAIRKDARKKPWNLVWPSTWLKYNDFKTWKRIRHIRLTVDSGSIKISTKGKLTVVDKNGKEK